MNDCKPDRIYNPWGDKPLHAAVRDALEWVPGDGKTHHTLVGSTDYIKRRKQAEYEHALLSAGRWVQHEQSRLSYHSGLHPGHAGRNQSLSPSLLSGQKSSWDSYYDNVIIQGEFDEFLEA